MRSVAARLVVTVAILGARFASASENTTGQLPVTIQIHDYARVPANSLSRATAVVTRIYEKIGVRTEWIGVVRSGERHARSKHRDETSQTAIAQLTMIMLTPQMAAQARVADGVLGYAAVADEGMGRIAFAIYDRVRSAATAIAADEGEVLGFVMAHEIGHLVLPRGSQPQSGLMKNHWNVRELRHVNLLDLQFSELQASQIRSSIENASPRIAAR